MAYIGNKPPIVSNLISDIKIGEDDETKIDFADANTINFHANNSKEMVLVENALTPGTSDGIALGTGSLMWSDLFLASGSVINLNNGDITLTHSSETLTVAGGTLATAALTTSTIVASGIIKTDDGTDATSTTDGSLQTDGGLSVAKDTVLGNDVLLLSDSSVLKFGADSDTTLTHTDGTGLTLNSTNKLTFGDAASFIQQSSNGVLRIDGEATIDLNASTEVNVSAALTVGGRIVTDDTTNATSTTDGSLQTDGGLSVVLDAIFGDDVSLLTDSAVLNLGAGSDVKLTHDGDTGGTLSGTPIVIDSLGASALANDTYTGIVLNFISNGTIAIGNAVYVHTADGRVAKAQGNAVGTMPCIGVAVTGASDGGAIKILTHGIYNDSDGFGGDLTEGAIMYVDDDTAGLVTATIPDADGEFVQRVGIAVGPRDVFVNPSLDVIERD